MTTSGIKLTSLSHGGGCGCKIAPGVLSQILKQAPMINLPKELLAGIDNNEDAAVYQINEQQAIVATTDFFMPIVDDPFVFGQIAATNAISDIYAMGAQPLFALALLGMPVNVLPVDVIQQITAGGAKACADAGIMIAGGHSIDTVEPIYGLVVIGIVDPAKLKRNSGAKVGDQIILSKPLGVGILSAAIKQEKISNVAYQKMVQLTTQLNKPGLALAALEGVHALTDVTGFGLAGHLLEQCRGANLSAKINWSNLPIIPEAIEYLRAGIVTGASGRNWLGYGHEVTLADEIEQWQKHLLSDPQTSGGLLVSCAPEATSSVLQTLNEGGFEQACVIGEFTLGNGLFVSK